MSCKVKLSLEGPVDQLNDLASDLSSSLLALAAPPSPTGRSSARSLFATAARSPGRSSSPPRSASAPGGAHECGPDLQHGLALIDLRPGDGERDRQPVQRAHQVEPQALEIPRATGGHHEITHLGTGGTGKPRGHRVARLYSCYMAGEG